MFTTVSATLPNTTLLALLEYSKQSGGTADLSALIEEAIEAWLAARDAAPRGKADAPIRGYQWKCLFLPEGTVLRSWSYGEANYARVEGDRIIHMGRAVSPNQFARSFARSFRNAWSDLSVRRPGDKAYKKASVLRREIERDDLAERLGAPAREATTEPAPPATPSTPPPAPSPAPAARTPVTTFPTSPESVLAMRRNVAAGRAAPPVRSETSEGWDLPERRSTRFRMEDIALFD